jgi:hypothetical protein
MVAINTNPSQDSQLPEWRTKGKYTFPVLLSSGNDFVRTNYGVSGTPTNFILNADGRLVFRHLGYGPGNEKTMEVEIRELLGLDAFEGVEPPKAPTPPAVVK